MSLLPVGQFRVKHVREVGAGGLGRVDEVEVVQSNSRHAVGARLARKRMNEHWTPVHHERFVREIRAVSGMTHPNIVPFEGQNLPNGEAFYLMPLYTENLRQLLARAKTFPWANVVGFAALIADALAYAHDSGFIHRDLKPENVLLSDSNRPIVADWGIGYFVHRESEVLTALTRGGMGTEYYCSAEQWSTGKCGPEGDVYSLGMTIAELIEGKQREILPGWGLDSDVVEPGCAGRVRLNALLQRMTSAAAGRRPGSMREVAAALRACRTEARIYAPSRAASNR